ncbi:hypothetical protein [Microbispora rosea]|uniref:hypothetical protein n=1 Tax=Microbispora rosea TaxID=58117 RepID=UPI0033E5CC5C
MAFVGLIASLMGIATFLGISSVKDIPGWGSTPSPSAAASTPDPEVTEREAADDAVMDGDRACAKVLKRIDEMNRLAGNDAATFHPWAEKILELRTLLLRRWRAAMEDLPDGIRFSMQKIWNDYEKANWAWSKMADAIGRFEWKTASAYLDMYAKYDDSAIKRANDLGFSSCNYTWPRPSGL